MINTFNDGGGGCSLNFFYVVRCTASYSATTTTSQYFGGIGRLEAVLAVLPLLVAAEAVVWRTDEWQSSGPQTTEVEALVFRGPGGPKLYRQYYHLCYMPLPLALLSTPYK